MEKAPGNQNPDSSGQKPELWSLLQDLSVFLNSLIPLIEEQTHALKEQKPERVLRLVIPPKQAGRERETDGARPERAKEKERRATGDDDRDGRGEDSEKNRKKEPRSTRDWPNEDEEGYSVGIKKKDGRKLREHSDGNELAESSQSIGRRKNADGEKKATKRHAPWESLEETASDFILSDDPVADIFRASRVYDSSSALPRHPRGHERPDPTWSRLPVSSSGPSYWEGPVNNTFGGRYASDYGFHYNDAPAQRFISDEFFPDLDGFVRGHTNANDLVYNNPPTRRYAYDDDLSYNISPGFDISYSPRRAYYSTTRPRGGQIHRRNIYEDSSSGPAFRHESRGPDNDNYPRPHPDFPTITHAHCPIPSPNLPEQPHPFPPSSPDPPPSSIGVTTYYDGDDEPNKGLPSADPLKRGSDTEAYLDLSDEDGIEDLLTPPDDIDPYQHHTAYTLPTVELPPSPISTPRRVVVPTLQRERGYGYGGEVRERGLRTRYVEGQQDDGIIEPGFGDEDLITFKEMVMLERGGKLDEGRREDVLREREARELLLGIARG